MYIVQIHVNQKRVREYFFYFLSEFDNNIMQFNIY